MNTEPQPVVVIIADEAELLRNGIALALRQMPAIKTIHTCASGTETLWLLEKHPAHLILLGCTADMTPETLRIKEMKHKCAGAKIIVLGESNEHEQLLAVVNSGASGYILKTSNCAVLALAVKKVLEGSYYFQPQETTDFMANVALKKLKKISAYDGPDFSDTEKQVMRYIYDELTNKEIAAIMEMSENAIENLRSSIFKKTGAKNMAGVIKFALRKGIVTDLEI